MAVLERPRLRSGLAVIQDDSDPRHLFLYDRMRISPTPYRLSWQELGWIQFFNGEMTFREVQHAAMQEEGGTLLPLDLFQGLAERLDSELYLDSQRYRDFLTGPIREPSCIGCYSEDPEELRQQLHQLFVAKGGPGLPSDRKPDGTLRAALLPHIDYGRGGKTYAWGFKEVVERTDAGLFVIIGTSHYSGHRFTLTRKNFSTPLGVLPTDQAYIDRLVSHYGEGLFDDEVTHVPEHSIELEVVFLQFLYETRRPIRIAPLVVGSFQDSVYLNKPPCDRSDIRRMIEALRAVEAEMQEPICYIISGDLAHLGPKFDDPLPVKPALLKQSRKQDEALLRSAEKCDADSYFRIIAAEEDSRRICGLPPTYTVLEAAKPRKGKLLHYDQYVHEQGYESVSFASMAFYR